MSLKGMFKGSLHERMGDTDEHLKAAALNYQRSVDAVTSGDAARTDMLTTETHIALQNKAPNIVTGDKAERVAQVGNVAANSALSFGGHVEQQPAGELSILPPQTGEGDQPPQPPTAA